MLAQPAKNSGQRIKQTKPDDARDAVTVPEQNHDQRRQPDQQQKPEHECQAGKQQQADRARLLLLQFNAQQLDMTVQQTQKRGTQAPR